MPDLPPVLYAPVLTVMAGAIATLWHRQNKVQDLRVEDAQKYGDKMHDAVMVLESVKQTLVGDG